MEAAVAHCSYSKSPHIGKILLDFDKDKTENDEAFHVDNPNPDKWTMMKRVPKISEANGKPVIVNGQQVIVEIEL